MAIHSRTLNDNSGLMQEIAKLNPEKGDVVKVKINLPEYVDITSMLAMYRRMVQAAEQSGVVLRLMAKTSNMEVEKYATRLIAERNDLFLTVDWEG